MPDRDFDLGQQIAELRGIVVQGFDGVHKREETTNGRIGKAEDRLLELERAKDKAEGRGAGTVGTLDIGAGEWVNSAAQITSVQLLTSAGQTLLASSSIEIFGKNP